MDFHAIFDNSINFLRPSRILDQHFGLTLNPDDFFQPLTTRAIPRSPAGYLRPWRSAASEQDVGSTMKLAADKFEASLDVQQFKPEELTVKVTEDSITVEGKHENKEDEYGSISRHFVRRYFVPKNYDISRVESKLSSDGILTIMAPKSDSQIEYKAVTITQTGLPAK